MIQVNDFVSTLNSQNVTFFCGVPDSLLKNFCAYVTDHCGERHVITANEGGAVGMAAGHYLATGKMACVYMQNSGQGNAVNPLASLADPDVYSIPMILLVGWRGMPGEHDEPQHVKQGKVTISLFETLGIPVIVLEDEIEKVGGGGEREKVEKVGGGGEEKVEKVGGEREERRGEGEQWKVQVSEACELAMREKRPVALIVKKGLFGDYALQNKEPNIAELKREDAIEGILKALPKDAVIVSTTGMISREVYELRAKMYADGSSTKDDKIPLSTSTSSLLSSHARDFLTVGSMGHASMIAMGIAKAQPKRLVVCLDGDGASIMQMGNMAIVGQSKCGNLVHIVLNNSAHDSVGGQPTIGGKLDFEKLAETFGYYVLQSPESQYVTSDLTAEQVCEAVRFDLGTLALSEKYEADKERRPYFMEIKVAKGARKDLGRPKEPPQVNKALFMKTLGV